MNAKIIITILIAILTANIAHPRNQQQPDSLSRQLQEVVVTAKQPATRLVGSTRNHYSRVESRRSRHRPRCPRPAAYDEGSG